jgi:hypothetical protein
MTQLTPHFSLEELVRSSTADRYRLDNTPTIDVLRCLQVTAELLEKVRLQLGRPVIVTSGYRSLAVNRAVGGVKTSDHTTGQAADIVSPAFGTPYQVARALVTMVSVLGIGQLILEGIGGKQWVHVSTHVPPNPSNRILTITDAGMQLGIVALPS